MGTQLPLLQRGTAPRPIFGPNLLRPNGCIDQDVTWYGARPRSRRLCDRWGPSPFPRKGAEPPKFSAHVYCGQLAGWIKMPLGTKVDLSPGDSVLDGDPAPSPQRGWSPPQFLAHFYCGQTAGCIKMPLGMEVDLRPVDFVLNGDPASLHKNEAEPPVFGPCLLWPNGWMDQDGT